MESHTLLEPAMRAIAYGVRDGIPMPNDSHFVYKVRPEDTGGLYALVEGGLAPRMLIPPHIHTREDEVSILIKGRLGVRIGDQEFELEPGGVALKPRGIPHAMWNPTDEPNLQLEFITPGGYVKFWEEVATLKDGWQSPEAEAMAERYGQRWLRDEAWVPELIRRHELRA